MKKCILAGILLASGWVSAQFDYKDSNMIGIFGGFSQTSLNTSDFDTKASTGWNVGFSVRGNWYNNFDMVYSIQFSENQFSAMTANPGTLSEQEIDFKIQGVKIMLTPSYNLIYNYLSVEAGPVLQVNGKLKYNSEYENNLINGTSATVKDIEKVSTFNVLGTVGITAGVRNARLNVAYQYGFNNFLSQVNDEAFGSKPKGHLGILTGNFILYF